MRPHPVTRREGREPTRRTRSRTGRASSEEREPDADAANDKQNRALALISQGQLVETMRTHESRGAIAASKGEETDILKEPAGADELYEKQASGGRAQEGRDEGTEAASPGGGQPDDERHRRPDCGDLGDQCETAAEPGQRATPPRRLVFEHDGHSSELKECCKSVPADAKGCRRPCCRREYRADEPYGYRPRRATAATDE